MATIRTEVRPLEWTKRCFESGVKVSGNVRAVTLMYRDDELTNIFPVHQDVIKPSNSDGEDDEDNEDEG